MLSFFRGWRQKSRPASCHKGEGLGGGSLYVFRAGMFWVHIASDERNGEYRGQRGEEGGRRDPPPREIMGMIIKQGENPSEGSWMDGARQTSRPAAAMKTVRSSLRQLSWSPSPEPHASRFWRADATETPRRRREYQYNLCFLQRGEGESGWGLAAKITEERPFASAPCTPPICTHNGTGCTQAGCVSSRRIWALCVWAAGPGLWIYRYICFCFDALMRVK